MELEINGKIIEIKAGLRFIKYLDEKNSVDQGGISFGIGVQAAYTGLVSRDPLILVELIKAGQSTSKDKATTKEIEDYIEGLENLEELFESFLALLNENSVTKGQIQMFKKLMEKERDQD